MKLILIALAGASIGVFLGRNWPVQSSPVEPAHFSPQPEVSPPSVVSPQGQMAAIPDSHNERVTATNAIECLPSLRALGCPEGILAQLVRFAFRQAHQAEYCELEAPLDYMADKTSQLLARQQLRIQLEKGEENALKESGLPRSGANGNALFSALFGISFQQILGYVFYPLAWLVGIPLSDALHAGSIMATKLVANEFVAMIELQKVAAEMTPRGLGILSVFLVSFANFASIGIVAGAIKGLNEQQGNVVSRFGLRLVYGATLVSLLSAAFAGVVL